MSVRIEEESLRDVCRGEGTCIERFVECPLAATAVACERVLLENDAATAVGGSGGMAYQKINHLSKGSLQVPSPLRKWPGKILCKNSGLTAIFLGERGKNDEEI